MRIQTAMRMGMKSRYRDDDDALSLSLSLSLFIKSNEKASFTSRRCVLSDVCHAAKTKQKDPISSRGAAVIMV